MITVHGPRDVKTLYEYLEGRSIAIVGNAPRILDRNDGSEIDRHDVVIRFNKGYPSVRYESLGQRTNILSIFGPGCDIGKFENVSFVVSLGTLWDHADKDCTYFYPYGFLHNDLIKECPSKPSSGCIWFCECLKAKVKNIDFYGRDKTTKWSFHHVSENMGFTHAYPVEEKWMIELASKYQIPFNII